VQHQKQHESIVATLAGKLGYYVRVTIADIGHDWRSAISDSPDFNHGTGAQFLTCYHFSIISHHLFHTNIEGKKER
jgi:hypothetical protein